VDGTAFGWEDTHRGEHRTEVTEEFFVVQVFGGFDKPHGCTANNPIPKTINGRSPSISTYSVTPELLQLLNFFLRGRP
jgi:hypothetical protein